MRRTTLLLLGPILAALGLTVSPAPAAEGEANPPAEGFDLAGSDPRAVELADRVMNRMGGRAAWDRTRHLRWRFFGRRLHVWDKQTGHIRVEGVGRDDGEPYVILMNLESKKGRAWRSGREIEEPAELAEMLDFGEAAWINDSYWMFMPYKLKDSGVTLEYLGEREMEDGRVADVLQLTFHDVGRTPENKYHVYVARDTGLVEQWSFFRNAGDEEPEFKNPWHNWQSYGEILLSDNRGEGGHTELAVFGELPDSVFRDPAPVDWSALE
jgi:hypothetical protein